MSDKQELLEGSSLAYLTSAAGTEITKVNVFHDYCVCSKCGYDFRLTKEKIKSTYNPNFEIPQGFIWNQPWYTMCPSCGNWEIYKELATSTC